MKSRERNILKKCGYYHKSPNWPGMYMDKYHVRKGKCGYFLDNGPGPWIGLSGDKKEIDEFILKIKE